MKFLRTKYSLIGALIIVFFAVGAYIQITKNPWVRVPKNITSQLVGNQKNTKTILYNGKLYKVIKQADFSKNQFSSQQMNVSFSYPNNIKSKQITPNLVALSNPAVKDTDDNILYIYSTTVPEDSIAFKIPFNIPGSLKQTKLIRTQIYTANQETYSDGKNTITLLIIRQNQQTIVLRIPPDSSYVSETITDIMNSIQVLH